MQLAGQCRKAQTAWNACQHWTWSYQCGHQVILRLLMKCGQYWRLWLEMVVHSWHWYRNLADDGSLVLTGVDWSDRRGSCGKAPLYLEHWTACITDLTEASANPLDCE